MQSQPVIIRAILVAVQQRAGDQGVAVIAGASGIAILDRGPADGFFAMSLFEFGCCVDLVCQNKHSCRVSLSKRATAAA